MPYRVPREHVAVVSGHGEVLQTRSDGIGSGASLLAASRHVVHPSSHRINPTAGAVLSEKRSHGVAGPGARFRLCFAGAFVVRYWRAVSFGWPAASSRPLSQARSSRCRSDADRSWHGQRRRGVMVRRATAGSAATRISGWRHSCWSSSSCSTTASARTCGCHLVVIGLAAGCITASLAPGRLDAQRLWRHVPLVMRAPRPSGWNASAWAMFLPFTCFHVSITVMESARRPHRDVIAHRPDPFPDHSTAIRN